MRLSDVKGERALDVAAAIAEPLFAIVTDEDFQQVAREAGKASPADSIKALAPVVMGKHKGETVAVLSLIAGKSEEEYLAGTTLASLVQDVFELVTDDAFKDFLA